jgi:hypothetical protein
MEPSDAVSHRTNGKKLALVAALLPNSRSQLLPSRPGRSLIGCIFGIFTVGLLVAVAGARN